MTRVLSVEAYLRTHGPALSSDVSAYFQQAGLSSAAARKRIERSGDEVRRLRRVRLPHNQRFLYLEDQFGKKEFQERLIDGLDRVRSVFGQALFAMEARGGIVPKPYFSIISGCPERVRGHLSPTTVLEILEGLGAVIVEDIDEVGPCVRLLWPDQRVSPAAAKARLIAEDILLFGVMEWVRRLGLVSFNAVRARSLTAQPDFASVRWDIVGPSYISPLTTTRAGKTTPGFFAADVFISDLDERSVRYLLHKFGLLRSNAKLRPVIGMLVAGGFSPEAMKALKAAGILCPTVSNLLGNDIFESLLGLLRTLENAAVVAATAPDQIYTLFTKLGPLQGALGRMRGAMFELIVAHAVQAGHGGSVNIGQRVLNPTTGESAEIDVFLFQSKQLWFYECKGYGPKRLVSVDEARHWSEKQIPRVREWAAANPGFTHHEQSFEFWTTSGFTAEAIDYLASRWVNTRKFKVHWRSGTEVSAFVEQHATPSVVKTLQEFSTPDLV